MFIELSEALACPACGPPQGLVVVVDRLDGRRVLDGFLGCPICEARFPIRGGVVDLNPAEASEIPGRPRRTAPAVDSPRERDAGLAVDSPPALEPEDAAVLVAALFDATDGRGYVLLDEPIEALAPRVAELTGGCEVIALADRVPAKVSGTAAALAAGTNRVEGAGDRLPVQSGRLRALALARPTESRLGDAIRVLGPEGRLVILQPSVEVRDRIDRLPVRALADEAVAFLGVVTAGS